MTIVAEFKKLKLQGRKLTVVTSYDYWSARILSESDVDGILVGDCSAMVVHGEENTLSSDIDMIALHTRAVSKGAGSKLVIAALPFMAIRKGFEKAMSNVEILIKAGAQAVKIEGVDGNERLLAHLAESGVPVVGHTGLTPSRHHYLRGFKVQGKTTEAQDKITEDARRLEQLGCFAVVLEAVPPELGSRVRAAVGIPVIGVGAGPDVDGQALVSPPLESVNVPPQLDSVGAPPSMDASVASPASSPI